MGGERYRVLRQLGSGGMGTVDLVDDRDRGQHVARKRVSATSPEAARRFKREFRAVERLIHPNLVRLYELGEDDEGLYFTMEYVPGRDWASYCRRGVPFDHDALARLVHTLPQVVDGLAFLHDNGIVHRDIKPDNVLVRDSGQVTILDFGVLAELGAGHNEIAGTPGYVAPEHLLGQAPSPASDVYALGAALYSIIAGQPVFGGNRADMRRGHLSETPPPLPAAPAALNDAVLAMLSKQPERRPSLRSIARELVPALNGRAAALAAPAAPAVRLVGRRALQDRLHARIVAASDAMLVLAGPSGVGKTVLMDWLLRRVRRSGGLALRGGARASHRVAFNAIDPIVDELARTLALSDTIAATAREQVRTLAGAFPIVASLVGVDHEREQSRRALRARMFGAAPEPAVPSRVAIFGALGRLIDGLGNDGQPTVLAIDDLQWADDDSLAALEQLLRDAPVGRTIVATLRDDMGDTAAARWLHSQAHARVITVPPLSAADLTQVVLEASARTDLSKDDAAVTAAVTAAAGRPYIAELLGRTLALDRRAATTAAPLADLVATAAEQHRRILAALYAADGPEVVAAIAALIDAAPGEVDDALTQLAAQGLVRRTGFRGGSGVAMLYHDTVAAAVHRHVDDAMVRAAHEAYARRDDLSDERRVRHLLGSSQPQQAARFARRSARAAFKKGAYALAAEMADIAVDHSTDDTDAMLELAALARERGADFEAAATAWRRLATRRSGEPRSDALFHQAHCLLAVGRSAAGWRIIDELLVAAGCPTTAINARQKLAVIARFVAGPGRGRAGRAQRGDLRRTLELATFISFLEPMAGLRILQHLEQRARRSGDTEAVAYCHYSFAYAAEFTSGVAAGPSPLAVRYRRAARRQLRTATPSLPFVAVFPHILDAIVALRSGNYDAALDQLARGEARSHEGGALAPMEAGLISYARMLTLVSAQRLPELVTEVQAFDLRVARGGVTQVLPQHAMAALGVVMLQGRWDDARALLAEAGDAAGAPTTHQTARAVYGAYIETLDGDPRRARALLAAALPPTRWLLLGRSILVSCGWTAMAGLIEINAVQAGDPHASLRRGLRFIRRAKRAPPVLPGIADRYAGYAADAAGDPERALVLLATAESAAARCGRRVDEAIARYQRGRRLGGDLGAELCRSARELVHELGARPCVLDEDPRFR